MTGKAKKPSHPDEHGVRHITRGSDNLFEDLGFERAEATHLLAYTDAAITHWLAVRGAGLFAPSGRFNRQVNWVEVDVNKDALDIDH